MDKALSNTISMLRLPLAIMVVLLHIHPAPVAVTDPAAQTAPVYNMVKICLVLIANLAVPCFFIMSGYLLMIKDRNYMDVIKTRTISLVIPYILWNILGAGYLQLSGQPVEWSFRGIFLEPVNFPLWFLRDLIVLSFMYPLFRFMINRLKWTSLIVITILFFCYGAQSLFFFYTGCFLTRQRLPLNLSRKSLMILTLLIFAVYLCDVVFFKPGTLTVYHDIWLIVGSLYVFVLVYNIWGKKTVNKKYGRLSSSTYFVYLSHKLGPVYISKLPWTLLPDSEITGIISLLFSPFLAVAICILIYAILRRIMPRVFGIAIGSKTR